MKPTKFISALLFTILLVTMSCQKDDGNSGDNGPQENIPDSFSEYFGNDISRDFLGTVIDKNHNSIEGVTITIGNETAMTDSNGVFIIRNADIKERFGYIKAEKAGYIHGSRSVVPSEGTNKVQIMLLEATVVGSVSSGSSDTVTADDGSSVSFDGNFIKEDGTAYTGSVDVIMHHLDPSDDDMTLQMPGMLYAENEDGAERMLQTLGMLAVELRGSDGEDLNLAEGSTSEIRIPVDASLINIAPSIIPLWYFDEANGYWVEEGEATLQGNMYVGTVSHFSFWNCDIPAEAIMLCITVVDEDGKELNNVKVTLTSETYGTTVGYTNELGQVCGLVPSNETLTLNVFSYAICGDSSLHTETVGPFSTDSDITVIINDNPNIIEETVVGTFNDCEGNPITEGYVQITYGGTTFADAVNADGSFEIVVLRCAADNTFSLIGNDVNNAETTGEINFTFTSPLTNIREINACNAIDEYITYTIDNNTTQVYLDCISVRTTLDVSGNPLDSYNICVACDALCEFFVRIPKELGTSYTNVADVTSLTFRFNDNGTLWHLSAQEDDVAVNVNYLGENVGEYIDVNFTGEFTLQDTVRTIEGSLHIKIDQL